MDCKQQILTCIIKNKNCSPVFLQSVLSSSAQIGNNSILVPSFDAEFEKFFSACLTDYPYIEINKWNNCLSLTGDIERFLNELDFFNHLNLDFCSTEQEKLTVLRTCFYLSGKLYYNADNEKNSKGYRLEFVQKLDGVANSIMQYLSDFGFDSKKTTRKPYYVVYIKKSATICDIFVKLGAQYTALEIQNSLAIREIRNATNRQNNCFESNLEKTITACGEQMNAINYILKNYSIDYLDENLREVAIARLANPDCSLGELKIILNNSLSRTGIKYRLDKIIELYKTLKGEKQ